MKSRARALGHPIHPMLVALPIGLWIISLVFDFVYLWRGDMFWYDLSYWDMIAGTAAAGVAAVPGFVDYIAIADMPGVGKTANRHFITVLIIVSIYVGDILLRTNHKAISGSLELISIGLSAVAVGLLGLAGWFGGE